MRKISSRSVDFIWSDNSNKIEIERKGIHVDAYRIPCSDDWKITIYNIHSKNVLLCDDTIKDILHYEARDIIMERLKVLLCKAKKH